MPNKQTNQWYDYSKTRFEELNTKTSWIHVNELRKFTAKGRHQFSFPGSRKIGLTVIEIWVTINKCEDLGVEREQAKNNACSQAATKPNPWRRGGPLRAGRERATGTTRTTHTSQAPAASCATEEVSIAYISIAINRINGVVVPACTYSPTAIGNTNQGLSSQRIPQGFVRSASVWPGNSYCDNARRQTANLRLVRFALRWIRCHLHRHLCLSPSLPIFVTLPIT